MKKSVFFLSTGRTGTHFLQTFFQEHFNNTLSVWEPNPSFKRRSTELIARQHSFYEKFYFSLPRKWKIIRSGCNFYVEANSSLYGCIPLIKKTFRNPFIVHIVRDGRDVVKSFMNSFKRYAKDPYGNGASQLKPTDFENDPFESRWNSMNPIQKTAWFWLRVNETIERSNPDLTVKFEKLFSPPHHPLSEIIKLFDEKELPKETIQQAFQDKESSASIDYIPEWENWPDLWKTQFDEICGDKMREYGYFS